MGIFISLAMSSSACTLVDTHRCLERVQDNLIFHEYNNLSTKGRLIIGIADFEKFHFLSLYRSRTLYNTALVIRASVDALSRDGPGQISRERVQRGRLTRQGTTS